MKKSGSVSQRMAPCSWVDKCPGPGVKSHQEEHIEGRLRPTDSVKSQNFY